MGVHQARVEYQVMRSIGLKSNYDAERLFRIELGEPSSQLSDSGYQSVQRYLRVSGLRVVLENT